MQGKIKWRRCVDCKSVEGVLHSLINWENNGNFAVLSRDQALLVANLPALADAIVMLGAGSADA